MTRGQCVSELQSGYLSEFEFLMFLVLLGFIFTVINFPRESVNLLQLAVNSCWSVFELEDRQLVIFLSHPLCLGGREPLLLAHHTLCCH